MDWGEKKVIAVGGGKGGIGKTCFAANLGVRLAGEGKRTVLVDADLGAANLHTVIGVKYPDRTLDDFVKERTPDLEQVLLPTPYHDLRLLSSASDILSIAQPNYRQRQRLYRAIQKLETDVIVFDIAAGTHTRAIDFFTLAPVGIIIVEPIATSLENAFSFLKNLLMRHLLRTFYQDRRMRDFIQGATDPRSPGSFIQFSDLLDKVEEMEPEKTRRFRELFSGPGSRVYLVINSVKTAKQFQVAEKFTRIVKRYLTLDARLLGGLPYEPAMDDTVSARTPFIVRYPQSGYARGIAQIAANLPV